MEPVTLAALFDELRIPSGGIVYVQSSGDWLQKAGFGPAAVLAALRELTGPEGTLVMPSYPSRKLHREYLESRPRYDVRRTPVGVGLIPELFRRAPDVRRSLDPDYPVAATGALAETLTATRLDALDPFGADSPYARMLELGGTLLGLGVSLNTNSFIHALDSRLGSGYPAPVYEGLYEAEVVDWQGQTTVVRRMAVRPPFQRLPQPGVIARALEGDDVAFRSLQVGGTLFFKLDLARWAGWCEAHAAEAAREGSWPCWLARMIEVEETA